MGRGIAVVLAVAFFAAACGSEASTVADTPTTVDSGSAGDESEQATADDTSSDSSAATTTAEVAGPKPVGDHQFPDLNTVKISDGSTVNLAAELAGGDTPVLLWFWAPH